MRSFFYGVLVKGGIELLRHKQEKPTYKNYIDLVRAINQSFASPST